MDSEDLTPAMKQYVQLKQQYPDCIILFRMGDFYEMFYEDAECASRVLEIALTSRGKGERSAPLAGIPYHALDSYLVKLVKNGHKVAICEQLEDPKKAKGLVKRGVVRIVTPGTLVEQSGVANFFIMSIWAQGATFYSALCDLSTGEFFVQEGIDAPLVEECVLPQSLFVNTNFVQALKEKGYHLSSLEDKYFSTEVSFQTLLDHFHVLSLEGFDLSKGDQYVRAAGALLSYLCQVHKTSLEHIKNISFHRKGDAMVLDYSTVRNLELLANLRDGTEKGTVIEILDHTITPMGSRLLRNWVLRPLLDISMIFRRQERVSYLVRNLIEREELRNVLRSIGDIERLISKVHFGTANPRDLLVLKRSLLAVAKIKIHAFGDLVLFGDFFPLVRLLDSAIKEDAPLSVREGGFIQREYDPILKELYTIRGDSKRYLSELEQRERERTGIKNLRVGYNRVFGYYFEISTSQLNQVPSDFIRKQTLSNYERFVTEELKREEEKILTAQEKIEEIEYDLFLKVLDEVKPFTSLVQKIAHKIAEIDVLCSFAWVSVHHAYACPVVDTSSDLQIVDGRHPVVELTVPYVPNDLHLGGFGIMIITGPNFSGKSCYMKQVALIILFAHIGCFVPAREAHIGLVDRIFTRMGVFDDVTSGQSTFMIEMSETARILNSATSRSLILLDEIGRGTSTYDGLAIAWAVIEYIHSHVKAKTLFATHYHALNSMEGFLEYVQNYMVAVREEGEEIVFLRKIVRGGTDKSFGLYVARLAGIPDSVLQRAEEVQKELEQKDPSRKIEAKRHEEQQKLS